MKNSPLQWKNGRSESERVLDLWIHQIKEKTEMGFDFDNLFCLFSHFS